MLISEGDPIKKIIEGDFVSRIHALDSTRCSSEVAVEKIDMWRKDGHFSVFTAGTFDLLTLNHILGLIQYRAIGAAALVGLGKIETEQDQRLVHEVAASDSIRLMVTVDTNRALEEGKSRRADKGGAPKPTLDWGSRAVMLAMQTIPSPDYSTRRAAVDFITRHGPDCCDACEPGTCVNEDNAVMAEFLQPDLVVINSESRRTVQDMERLKLEDRLPRTDLAIVVEADNQYHDPILDGPVKTTSIINRIRS